MTIKAPVNDKIIPVNFNLVNLSLKIKRERMVITEGFNDIIIAARLAVINFKPEKKKKLYPTIPVMPRQIINMIWGKFNLGNPPCILITMNTKKIDASRKRKKAEVKGGRFVDITLPAIKVPPKNSAARNNLI